MGSRRSRIRNRQIEAATLRPEVARIAPRYRDEILDAIPGWPKDADRQPAESVFTALGDAPELRFEGIVCSHRFENGRLHYSTKMIENLIHPEPLPFTPPLIEFAGTPDKEGHPFTWNWQKLHHVFQLPNPYEFRSIPTLDTKERKALRSYVDTCQALAGYSALSHVSTMFFTYRENEPDILRFETDAPSLQESVAYATTFRKVHGPKENTRFDIIHNILGGHLHGSPAGKVVSEWRRARARLMNESIQTLQHRMVVPEVNPSIHRNFEFVKPQELINTFFYGELIHTKSEYEAAYADITRTPEVSGLYRYALQMSMASLAHLYFGFAVLVQQAMRDE